MAKVSTNKKVRHPVTGCRVSSLFDDIWLMSAEHLESRLRQIVKLDLNKLVEQNMKMEEQAREQAAKVKGPRLPYKMAGSTAVIDISGPTTKYPTSFQMLMGGTSTMLVQRQIAHALRNESVSNILLHIEDCPGGNAAGAFDLSDDIFKAREIKPVWVHIDDAGTSAAQLFASQGSWTSANRNAQVGSVGVVTKLEDTSKAYEARGVRVIPIIAGKLKGIGMEGVKISDEQIAEIEARVQDVNELFIEAVSRGRGLNPEKIRGLEARTFIADRGKKHGLIDEIASFDSVVARMREGKIPEAARRGPAKEDKPNPAATRSRVMLNAEQLKEAKGLPGAAHISADNADNILLQTATSLHQEVTELREEVKKAPKGVKLDPKLAEGHAKLFLGNLELKVKEGNITVAQRDVVKTFLMPEEGKYNLSAIQPDGTVLLSGDAVIAMLGQNKPSGINKDLTGAQPAGRTEPGKEGEEDKVKYPTFAEHNQTRADNGLPEITMEAYRNLFPQAPEAIAAAKAAAGK
jgi:signal peptide peptidase SppA